MDYEKELRKQYEECANSGYFFFVPEQSLYPLMDLILKHDDILLLKPINFKKSYFELIEKECSDTNVSVDVDGCLGQG